MAQVRGDRVDGAHEGEREAVQRCKSAFGLCKGGKVEEITEYRVRIRKASPEKGDRGPERMRD